MHDGKKLVGCLLYFFDRGCHAPLVGYVRYQRENVFASFAFAFVERKNAVTGFFKRLHGCVSHSAVCTGN